VREAARKLRAAALETVGDMIVREARPSRINKHNTIVPTQLVDMLREARSGDFEAALEERLQLHGLNEEVGDVL